MKELAISLEDGKPLSNSQLILRSYLKWGYECVEHLFGDFVFAIWDPQKHILYCARDHFGCRPLYYVDRSGYFAVTSDPNFLKTLPGFKLEINEEYILDSICTIVPEKNKSAFIDVQRLVPAHYCIFSIDKPLEIRRYWELGVNPKYSNLNIEEAIKGIKERFLNAVKQRTFSEPLVGVELSGGLDSSSVTACARLINPEIRIEAFSHGLSAKPLITPESYDNELSFVELLKEHHFIDRQFIITGENQPGLFTAIENSLNENIKPTIRNFSLGSDLLYKRAKHSGINVLLSGFGGDEGITNQGSGYLEELANNLDFKQLKTELRILQGDSSIDFLTKVFKLLVKVKMLRFLTFLRRDRRKSRFRYFAINNVLNRKYGMRKKYNEHLYWPNDPNVRNRQLFFLLHPTLLERLECSFFDAKAKGIEYRYPFLDVKLLEFYHSLNSEHKYNRGIKRYVFRMAMKGILPEEIRLRTNKSVAAIPYSLSRLKKDEFKFRELINESKNKNRFHYVDYDKLLWMIDVFFDVGMRSDLSFGARAIINPISVLVLQKWQRDGKIDIGIKC